MPCILVLSYLLLLFQFFCFPLDPACSNFSILFYAMCFSISLSINDIIVFCILYDTSVIAIGLSSVSVGLFFFGIMIVFDFFHSIGLCLSSSAFL